MPTSTGWKLLLVGLVTVFGGRAVGQIELYVIGVTAIAAVLWALVMRIMHPSRLMLERSTSSRLIAVSEQVTVSLKVTNRGNLASPTVRIHEPVNDGRHLGFVVGSLPGGKPATGRYRLRGTHRGVLELGPAILDDLDGLALARRRRRLADSAQVIVHPPVEQLTRSSVPVGESLMPLSTVKRRSLGLQSDDFDFLRPYVSGDDPRHVHWRSTARFDDLMVRHFRPERPGRLTLLIDTRPPGDLAATQDFTTSVAASVLAAVLAGGDEARLLTTDGRGTRLLTHRSHLVEALEFLALLEGGSEQLNATILQSGSHSDGAFTVAVTASPQAVEDPALRARLSEQMQASLLITCATDITAPSSPQADPSGRWIHLTGPGQLAHLWQMSRHAGTGYRAAR